MMASWSESKSFIHNRNHIRKDTVPTNEEVVSAFSKIFDLKKEAFGISHFINKNKEYEQSKEIIEEWKKVNNIQKLLSEKKIPFSVSIQEITEKNDEKIPINRNKKLIEELYNGNYKISNEYSDKQMIIDITNSKEINNLFYLDYLKKTDKKMVQHTADSRSVLKAILKC